MPRSWMVAAHSSSQLHLHSLDSFPLLPSTAGGAPLLTPPRSLRLRILCRLFTWTCGAKPASVDRVTRVTSQRLVVDDYSRYTTVFPLRSKGEVPKGIRQSFTLPASPQQNGIAERRIGMVMDVARTSMIHAAAPHFLWPFAVHYSAHQINLQPRRTSCPPVPFPVSSLASLLTHPGGSSTTPPRVVFFPLVATGAGAADHNIQTPCPYAKAIEGPYSSQWQAATDAEMASWKSTGTYVDEVPPPGANIVSGMWIFRVKRPPGSPPAFKARELTSYVGMRSTRDRAQRTIILTQSHMVQQVLQRFGFTYSSPQSTPLPTGHSLSAPPSDESVEPSGPYPELVGCLMYLMTCTRPDLAYPLSLLARYVAPGRHRKMHWDAAKRVLGHLCSTSGMGLVLGGRARVVLTGHADASWVDDLATQRSSQGYTFSLGSGSVSWRSTRSSSVLSSSCEAKIYAGAMAAQELRWLNYLLTDLGEAPRSPPVLYVDNKAMLALCEKHRLEHRTKHIALPCSRVAAAWPASSCLRGLSGQHC
ncbi:unnamed protein product [Closterium sp. NIES-54]